MRALGGPLVSLDEGQTSPAPIAASSTLDGAGIDQNKWKPWSDPGLGELENLSLLPPPPHHIRHLRFPVVKKGVVWGVAAPE